MKQLICNLIACSTLIFAACSNEKDAIHNDLIGGGDLMVVSLSCEEALSLVSDYTYTLSDDEVLQAVRTFSVQQEGQTTRAAVLSKMKILQNYKVACSNEATTRSTKRQDSIEFSLVDLGMDKISGIAVVCRDSRYPEVLAYVPTANIQTYQL